MYHLRTIKNGEETNIELGEEYRKVNLVKAPNHWLTKEIGEKTKDPNYYEEIHLDPPIFIIGGKICHQVKFDEETYIVDSNGNTYERISLKPWLSIDPEAWEEMWMNIIE